MRRANKENDPTRSYRCIFLDSDGDQFCQLDIVAIDFDHIERWATQVIERSADDMTRAEIWCDGERLALLGTAIAARPTHNGRLSPRLPVPKQRNSQPRTREL